MVAVGETMGLIANALEKPKATIVMRQPQRVGETGPVDLLELLGEADDRRVVKPETLKFGARGAELPLAPIDNDEIRERLRPCPNEVFAGCFLCVFRRIVEAAFLGVERDPGDRDSRRSWL